MAMEREEEMRNEAVRWLNSYKYSVEVGAKMEALRRVKEIVLHRAPRLLHHFLPFLLELQADPSSPIRKYLVEMIEEVGLKFLEHLRDIVPVLIAFLKDDTPAVARQAVTTGANLFRNTLEQVALQGIYSGHLDKQIEDSWAWMVKFKDAVYPIAFQPGADGVRLVAVKFVETMILLFTLDPSVSRQPPPPQHNNDGKSRGFDISWILESHHPILDAALLGQEANKNLGLLLDQLRLPDVKVLHSSVAIVLINSLASIAKKRPALFGRVLPVFLELAPSCEPVRGAQVSGVQNSVQNTLKNAFVGFIKCTNQGATPWRDRLVSALRAMNSGDLAEQALRQVEKMTRNLENSKYEASSEPPSQAYNLISMETGRKRTLVQETGNKATVDDKPGKRVRHNSPVLQHLQSGCDVINESATSNGNGPGSLMNGPEMTPVQQLVAMFGAIVAQGDRAVESLEILIARIPTDLLAEVVIANMHNLPSTPPTEDSDDHELPGGSQSTLTGNASQVVPSYNILSQVMALSTSVSQTSMPVMMTSQLPKSTAPSEVEMAVSQQLVSDTGSTSQRGSGSIETQHMSFPVPVSIASASMGDTSAFPFVSGMEVNFSEVQVPMIDSEKLIATQRKDQNEALQNIIPGLHGPISIDIKMETADRSSILSSVPMTSTQNVVLTGSNNKEMQETSLPGQSGINKSGSAIPGTFISEPIRSSAPITAMSGGTYTALAVTPPIINLSEEQQTSLSRMAFVRIIEAYRQVSSAGGCELRVALLTRLVDQCSADYDVREVLQKHILSDYKNFKGHELTLHVLDQLFGEMVSRQKDTGSSLGVASIYENFLLIVAQTLRDSLPASDKSLSKLLGEVPLLPDSAFKILENLCCVGRYDKDGKEALSGDRLTQGLSAVWSLILLRPPARSICLDIALQTAVHPIEDVRSKAIRLVANKLYPLNSISQNIEEFATKMMLSVADNIQGGDSMEIGGLRIVGRESINQQDLSNGWPKVSNSSRNCGESSNGKDQPGSEHSVSNVSITEAQRCMSLYFALCTKKPALLQKVFSMYKNAPKAVKQAVQRHIPLLIRTIVLPGQSSELLRIISNPPAGSESLLMQVLQILTDGTTPSPDLIATVKTLHETKLKDAGILIPILSSLAKDEVLPIFPQLVSLPPEKFQAALARILQGSAHTGPALTPAEVLIAIHGIDPERDGIPLKKVTDACSACFEQRDVFTQQVLAKVLNQLVEQTPIPLLFMRTVIQAIGAFPSLVDFIMEILSRLVSKQIWRFPKLWVGFLKCAYQTKPHSFHVLLQLPAAQLENALHKHSVLRAPLVMHANQPNIRSTLPRSTLVVLGLVQETQSANLASQNPQSMDASTPVTIANETQASESVAGS
ncbi:uncharacterized protein LOC131067516 isoform X2 [Cryptomeria japonica]|uniref:uncharacterized protein LOC131067516 isoform X2 n=1 Tax=Cryptomeria japonica TaxID=3369 RepID=UPI0027DAA8D7|nr:uncharacterized protein LOC131067516 isoform X2 [Cryptomeria japonica]